MASEEKMNEALDKLQNDLGGFIAASVVDLESGMTLAATTRRPDFDLALASAYNSEMVKAKLNTLRVLKLETNLEDMLLTLGDQIHLIKIVSESTFVYVAADRASTNLALVRSVVYRHVEALLS